MALGLDDVRVGVWTDPDVPTGVTVVLPPEGALGAVVVRGASPGTREAVALGPNGKLTVCHGVVLSGGSAFGLATADGVVRVLEEQGIGYVTPVARIPIVGAAIVFDQSVARPGRRPTAESGELAARAATSAEPPEGNVGAGAGVTVAKVGGLEHAWRSGQGTAVRRHEDLVVGAIVVNNAVGEVVGEDGRRLVATRGPADGPRFPYVSELPPPEDWPPGDRPAPAGGDGGPTANTVVGCIVTNAVLDKAAACRVADMGFTGVARAIDPPHTQADGDALFCLATQRVEATIDLVAHLAAHAVAEATRRGPMTAHGAAGLPGKADDA